MKLVLALAALLFPCMALGQIALVQQNTGQAPSFGFPQSLSVSFGVNVTAGDLIVVVVGQGCNRTESAQFCGYNLGNSSPVVAGTPQLSDSLGNPFAAVGVNDPSDEAGVFVFYNCDSLGGADTVTVSAVSSGLATALSKFAMVVQEFSGNDSSSLYGCQNNQNLYGLVRNTGQPGQGNSGQGNTVASLATVSMPVAPLTQTSNVFLWATSYDRSSGHPWTVTGTPSPFVADEQVQTAGLNLVGQSLLVGHFNIASTSVTPPPYQWTIAINAGGACNPGGPACSDYLQNFILAFEGLPHKVIRRRDLIF